MTTISTWIRRCRAAVAAAYLAYRDQLPEVSATVMDQVYRQISVQGFADQLDVDLVNNSETAGFVLHVQRAKLLTDANLARAFRAGTPYLVEITQTVDNNRVHGLLEVIRLEHRGNVRATPITAVMTPRNHQLPRD